MPISEDKYIHRQVSDVECKNASVQKSKDVDVHRQASYEECGQLWEAPCLSAMIMKRYDPSVTA